MLLTIFKLQLTDEYHLKQFIRPHKKLWTTFCTLGPSNRLFFHVKSLSIHRISLKFNVLLLAVWQAFRHGLHQWTEVGPGLELIISIGVSVSLLVLCMFTVSPDAGFMLFHWPAKEAESARMKMKSSVRENGSEHVGFKIFGNSCA